MFIFNHRNPDMQLDRQHTALVLANIQNEFLDPAIGKSYPRIEDALKERHVVDPIEQRLQTAQELTAETIEKMKAAAA